MKINLLDYTVERGTRKKVENPTGEMLSGPIPIERRINQIKKELDSLWDNPLANPTMEKSLNQEYETLKQQQLDGELWWTPF